jgi:hypothetical protein
MRTLRLAFLLAFILATAACSTIGHNETFMLQYKRDLHKRYADKEKKDAQRVAIAPASAPTDGTGIGEEAVAKQLALQSVYRSNLPMSVTDKYDTRAKDIRIRAGDPLNIIINRVYIRENGQRLWLLENSSDIAVVVTVDDGRNPEPKHVLVAYEQDVGSQVKLPVDDLIAYSTEAYADEPVRIEVTVLAMYSVRNRTYSQVLAAAAGIGAALSPAYAPAISAASQVGKAVINAKQDRVLAKFTFELYPWKPGNLRVTEGLGVPRVSYGQYLLLNAPNGREIGDPDNIHLDFSLIPYRVKPPVSGPVATVTAQGDLRGWPILPSEELPREPLELTHVILTVDNTKLSNAQQIITRADSANRVLAELAKDVAITPGKVSLVTEQLDDLKSKIRLQLAQSEFNRHKRQPEAIGRLFSLYEDKNLSENDKTAVLALIRDALPPQALAASGGDQAKLKKWYEDHKGVLVYDGQVGGYRIRKPEGVEK